MSKQRVKLLFRYYRHQRQDNAILYIAKSCVNRGVLSTFQRVKKPDYPVHPVGSTKSIKFTKEYTSMYNKRYYQQNRQRIKANNLKIRQHFLKYKHEYYWGNRESISLKTSVRETEEIRLMSCPCPRESTILIR